MKTLEKSTSSGAFDKNTSMGVFDKNTSMGSHVPAAADIVSAAISGSLDSAVENDTSADNTKQTEGN